MEALLAVQERDTAADRLRHRRANLPERESLRAAEAALDDADAALSDARRRLDDVLGRQAALESDVAAVRHRISAVEAKLYSGEVSATRDLMAMTAEVDSLRSRCTALEDEVLAAMEEAEPLAAEVSTLESRRAAVDEAVESARHLLGEAEREIDAELAVESEARSSAAAGVPADLLSTYEQLRARHGGVGAARLAGTTCTGCHLTLPASEIARVKREPPDALVLCDQCGRILVR